MTSDDRDPDLARLFEAERRADESAAPDLDELLARPRPHRARRTVTPRRLLAAAAVAIVLVAAAVLVRPGASRRTMPPSALPRASARLAEWKSPTGFLLRTPGSDLLAGVPILVSRPLALGGTAAPSPTKGVE